MARILVVDDQRNVRTTLAMLLRGAGHEVEEASDGAVAVGRLGVGSFDVLLTDLKMSGFDGIEVLRQAKEKAPATEVIVMTAYGTIDSAVEAMKIGALDYIQKPFTEDMILGKVAEALGRRRSARAATGGRLDDDSTELRPEPIIGSSPSTREMIDRIARVAPTDATVLITGESGTGKELVARAIHAASLRSRGPLVSVNCAAIHESLLESELFGHAKGAFTGASTPRRGLFEHAHTGTLFLDEVAETQTVIQAKLLRVLQDGEIRRVGENDPVRVDIRLIAATNQDLARAIAEKRFRADLFYRLNVVQITLAPLRERREDIRLLVEYFLEKYGRKMRRTVRLDDAVMPHLLSLDFPGNIRELENKIAQGVALALNGTIRLEDIETQREASVAGEQARSLQDIVDRAERDAIEQTLRETDGNRERTAEILGLSATTLWRKMKRLGVVG